MPIEFRCRQCHKLLRVPDESAGKQAKCPACETVQAIPGPTRELPGVAPFPSPSAAPLPAASDNPYASPMSPSMPLAGQPFDEFTTGPRTGPPWERDGASFHSFVETAKLIYGATGPMFSEMRREGGLGAPLLFGLAGGVAGYFVAFLFQFALQALGALLAVRNGAGLQDGFAPLAMMAAFSLIGIPIGTLLYMFASAGIYHLMLIMLGAARQPFETTFRVVAYSLGGASLVLLIPLCGQWISGVLTLVLVGIGLSRAHEISGGRAAAAVLLPIVICCGGATLLSLSFVYLAARQ